MVLMLGVDTVPTIEDFINTSEDTLALLGWNSDVIDILTMDISDLTTSIFF